MVGCALFLENTIQLSKNILSIAVGQLEVNGSKSSTLIKNYYVFGTKLDGENISMEFLIQPFCAVCLKIGFNH